MQATPFLAGDDLHSAGLPRTGPRATCGSVPFRQRGFFVVEPEGPQAAAGSWGAVVATTLIMPGIVLRGWAWD